MLEKFNSLKSHLLTVTPDTVLRHWKKQLAQHWAHQTLKRSPGRPPITEEIKQLFIKMKRLNPRFGALHIEGEMRLLGIDIGR